MFYSTKKIKMGFAATLVLAGLMSFLAYPKQAVAQAVPISTMFNYHSIMGNSKDFILDRLATMLAKQILHQMTASVINWINSGFEGSPSFLTDPQGFFLDAADQMTGEFIANSGPLSALCSPFNIDIRLSLALNQGTFVHKRYACTLGTIIESAKNGTMVNINGQSIGGFIKGDFSQGGWPAFVALTTEPQNNPYDAFLKADAELRAKISARQNNISLDLQIGQGFLSWQDCKEVGRIDPNAEDGADQYDQAEAMAAGDTKISTKFNSDGTISYRSCETKTPGSVISGTLQKQLNVPADELELANNINAVIDALISQLTNQMLTKGLKGLSGGGSSSSGGYTTRIIEQTLSPTDTNTLEARNRALNNFEANMKVVEDTISIYNQSINLVKSSEVLYENAEACFTTKMHSKTAPGSDQYKFAQTKISEIQDILVKTVDPLIKQLTTKRDAVQKQYDNWKQTSGNVSDVTSYNAGTGAYADSTGQIGTNVNNLNNYIDTTSQAAKASSDQTTANQDLSSAKSQAELFKLEAGRYQSACDVFPSLYSNMYNQM